MGRVENVKQRSANLPSFGPYLEEGDLLGQMWVSTPTAPEFPNVSPTIFTVLGWASPLQKRWGEIAEAVTLLPRMSSLSIVCILGHTPLQALSVPDPLSAPYVGIRGPGSSPGLATHW